MKVYVLKGKRLFSIMFIFIIVAATAFAIFISRYDMIEAFSAEKDLPIYSVERSDKKVAITFDCAWGASDIPDILSTLRKEDVKATFFMVGQWAQKYPDIAKMISNDGHDIGNHSYSHLRMGSIDNKSKLKDEIVLCGNKLNEITGSKIELFRAPYGDYNNSVIGTARDLGYYTIQWDVEAVDTKVKL